MTFSTDSQENEEYSTFTISDGVFNDYEELWAIAKAAIMEALDDGTAHGYKGEWKEKVSILEHLDHASDHADEAFMAVKEIDPNLAQMHITHAICRLAMALCRLDQEGDKE